MDRTIWRNRNFVLLLLGGAFSGLGYRIYEISISWFVIDLTGSSYLLGLLFAFWAVPNMIFMLVGGVSADKRNKIRIMVNSDLSRAFILLLLVILYATGSLKVWQLFLISMIFGISNALFVPSRDSLLPFLVSTDDIQKANSNKELFHQISCIAGPILAAFSIKLLGNGYAFLVPAIIIIISMVLIGSIQYKSKNEKSSNGGIGKSGFFKGIKTGFMTVKSKPSIVFLFIAMAIFNLGYFGPLMVGLPILSKSTLNVGVGGFSLLELALAIGMILGSVISSKVAFSKVGSTIFLITMLSGILFSFLGFSYSLPVSMCLLIIIGGLVSIVNILLYSTVQKQIPGESIGTVLGLLNFIVVGLDPITFFLSGLSYDLLPISIVFILGGSLIFVVGFIGMLLKSIRFGIDHVGQMDRVETH
jgi:MFS family permease